MRLQLVVIFALFVSSCATPPMFAVEVDEPIKSGTITLNDGSAPLIKNLDGAYWAKWTERDAKGKIVVLFPDGTETSCEISYAVGKSPQMQRFKVVFRQCMQIELK